MLRLTFLLPVALLFIVTVSAQVTITDIDEAVPNRTDTTNVYGRYKFPHITHSNQAVADTINASLLFNVLDIEKDSVKQSIFENVWDTEGQRLARLTFTQFSINYNSGNILSLDIATEGCGAYCEEFSYHFNYDTRTGESISLDSLFTEDGLKLLSQTIAKWQRDKIVAHIQLLASTKTTNEEDSIRSIDAIEMYNQCLERYNDVYLGKETIATYPGCVITSNSITIFGDRCSAHVNRALDDIGQFQYELAVKNYRKYLSPYGLSLFNFKK